MYDQEKIKKMKNHELAMEAYFYAYNHKLFGGASQKKAVKCYEQIILVLNQDERMNLPFISTFGRFLSPTVILTGNPIKSMSLNFTPGRS